MYQRLKKFIVCALLGSSILYSAPSSASPVWFSRANCINNESITWDWPGNSQWFWTNNYTYRNGAWEPTIATGWEYTYRSAAIHWGEGVYGGAFVVGDHWRWISWFGTQYFGRTQTNNCNLAFFFPY